MAVGNFVTNALNPDQPVNLSECTAFHITGAGLQIVFQCAGGSVVWKFDTQAHCTNAYNNLLTAVGTTVIAN